MTDSLAATPAALLALAIQDLYDGERAWVERTGALIDSVEDHRLAATLRAEITASNGRIHRLRAIATEIRIDAAGAENIWLRAILDDAQRDTTMIAEGALLDIALIGAFRKGVQAERVSYETALVLARALGFDRAASLLTTSRDELAKTDGVLAELLEGIAVPACLTLSSN